MTPVLLLLVFCVTLCYLYKFSKQRPPNFPPGPPRLPVWGCYWFVLLSDYNFLHIAFHKLAQKYRSSILGLHLGDFPCVVVHDYDSVRQVLTRPEFQGRAKSPIFDMRTYNKNLGIIFTDDQFWVQQRRFTLRYMREFGFGRRFRHLEDIMKDEIQDVLDLLNGRREDKEIFSDNLALVPDLFYSVIFNALWVILTGQRYSIKEHEKLRGFTQQALRFQKSIDPLGRSLVLTPWIRHFAPNSFGFTDLMESTQHMLKYVEEAVTQHKATYSEEHMRDFMDFYLTQMKKLEETEQISSFSDEQLKVVGLDMLFPGTTTVTSTLNFAILYLLHNPEVQTKMQQQLDAVVGRDRLPTLDDRAWLPYTEAFIREAMRKEPVAPLGVLHRATEHTELGGYNIPKDTIMILNLWSFQNDPNFWGDPEVFRPERFLDEKGHLLKDFSLPFGAGKRLCAGETISRHILFLTLSALLQNFRVKGAPGQQLPNTEPDYPGIIVTKKSMWIQFEPRA